MLERPDRFSEVEGNKEKIKYLQDNILKNSLPNFILLSGLPGVGKTTIGKLIAVSLLCTGLVKPCGECNSCKKSVQAVIHDNQNTDYIYHYKMSVEGSKERMIEILANMKPNFLGEDDRKVLLLDEAHRMDKDAQDSILIDTEYLDPRVFVILMTTDTSDLKEAVLSRALHLTLNTLSNADMRTVITREISKRKLAVENLQVFLEVLISYSEGKPRRALKVIEAMGTNRSISLAHIRPFVEYVDIQDIIPVFESFSGVSYVGIEAILKLQLTSDSKIFLCNILVDALKIKRDQRVTSVEASNLIKLRNTLETIEERVLMKFLYKVAGLEELTNLNLLHAFLYAHPELDKYINPPTGGVESSENIFRMMHRTNDDVDATSLPRNNTVPTIESLFKSGKILDGEEDIK